MATDVGFVIFNPFSLSLDTDDLPPAVREIAVIPMGSNKDRPVLVVSQCIQVASLSIILSNTAIICPSLSRFAQSVKWSATKRCVLVLVRRFH